MFRTTTVNILFYLFEKDINLKMFLDVIYLFLNIGYVLLKKIVGDAKLNLGLAEDFGSIFLLIRRSNKKIIKFISLSSHCFKSV